jgi:hypothetical protein
LAAGEGEVLEEGVPQEVASEAEAAEAGDTDGKNFILDLFPCPFCLTSSHPVENIFALPGVIKGAAFRTSNPGIFRRSGTPEEEKR